MRGLHLCLLCISISFFCPVLGEVSGEWSARYDLLPAGELDSMEVHLDCTFGGLKLHSSTSFSGEGFSSQHFGLEGTFFIFTLRGGMEFSGGDVVLKEVPYTATGEPASGGNAPAVSWTVPGPSYRSSYLDISFSLFSIDLSLEVEQWVDHVLTFSYGDFVEDWNSPCPDNLDYLEAALEREVDVTEARILYFSDPAKNVLLEEEVIEGPFQVRDDLGDFVPAARTFLESHAAERMAELGAASYEIEPPATEDLVFEVWEPVYVKYTLTALLPPFEVSAAFDEILPGIEFRRAIARLSSLPLCCGLELDAELSFTKCIGFEYLNVNFSVPLCCGFGLELGLRLTPKGLTTALDFKADLGSPCLRIYAEPVFSGEHEITGLEILGVEVRATLGEGLHFESLTAFDVEEVEDILGEDIFRGDEFEYFRIHVRGPVRCWGYFDFEASFYFEPSGLFGLSRMEGRLEYPLFDSLTLVLLADTSPRLEVGWRFSF